MITEMDSLQKTYHKDNINKKYIYLSTTKQQKQKTELQKSISVHAMLYSVQKPLPKKQKQNNKKPKKTCKYFMSLVGQVLLHYLDPRRH